MFREFDQVATTKFGANLGMSLADMAVDHLHESIIKTGTIIGGGYTGTSQRISEAKRGYETAHEPARKRSGSLNSRGSGRSDPPLEHEEYASFDAGSDEKSDINWPDTPK